MEEEPLCGVDEGKAQIFGHEQGGEILAPGHQLLPGDAVVHLLPQGGKFALQIGLQIQLVTNLGVALLNEAKNVVIGDTVLDVGVAQVEQVGDFVVVGETFSCGGHDHHPAGGVRADDVADLLILFGVGHGGSAKFQGF